MYPLACFCREASVAEGGRGGLGQGGGGRVAGHCQETLETPDSEKPVFRVLQIESADELLQHAEGVEVDALADQRLRFVEDEERCHSHPEPVAGGGNLPQRSEVGAHQPELDDDGVVAVSQRDDFVILVRECDARVEVILAHVAVAVVHRHGGDQLVVRVREGRQHVVPVLSHLIVEVVQHQFLTCLALLLCHHACLSESGDLGGTRDSVGEVKRLLGAGRRGELEPDDAVLADLHGGGLCLVLEQFDLHRLHFRDRHALLDGDLLRLMARVGEEQLHEVRAHAPARQPVRVLFGLHLPGDPQGVLAAEAQLHPLAHAREGQLGAAHVAARAHQLHRTGQQDRGALVLEAGHPVHQGRVFRGAHQLRGGRGGELEQGHPVGRSVRGQGDAVGRLQGEGLAPVVQPGHVLGSLRTAALARGLHGLLPDGHLHHLLFLLGLVPEVQPVLHQARGAGPQGGARRREGQLHVRPVFLRPLPHHGLALQRHALAPVLGPQRGPVGGPPHGAGHQVSHPQRHRAPRGVVDLHAGRGEELRLGLLPLGLRALGRHQLMADMGLSLARLAKGLLCRVHLCPHLGEVLVPRVRRGFPGAGPLRDGAEHVLARGVRHAQPRLQPQHIPGGDPHRLLERLDAASERRAVLAQALLGLLLPGAAHVGPDEGAPGERDLERAVHRERGQALHPQRVRPGGEGDLAPALHERAIFQDGDLDDRECDGSAHLRPPVAALEHLARGDLDGPRRVQPLLLTRLQRHPPGPFTFHRRLSRQRRGGAPGGLYLGLFHLDVLLARGHHGDALPELHRHRPSQAVGHLQRDAVGEHGGAAEDAARGFVEARVARHLDGFLHAQPQPLRGARCQRGQRGRHEELLPKRHVHGPRQQRVRRAVLHLHGAEHLGLQGGDAEVLGDEAHRCREHGHRVPRPIRGHVRPGLHVIAIVEVGGGLARRDRPWGGRGRGARVPGALAHLDHQRADVHLEVHRREGHPPFLGGRGRGMQLASTPGLARGGQLQRTVVQQISTQLELRGRVGFFLLVPGSAEAAQGLGFVRQLLHHVVVLRIRFPPDVGVPKGGPLLLLQERTSASPGHAPHGHGAGSRGGDGGLGHREGSRGSPS
ncbi:hypothetical protein STIAU_6465 [Stigmatella aurantiaca DW4/3-1]|uniref:Uncharacterized protein n=1 Tax=Stigmatella aurantiaca (strain DW4/3-1) TaxID=378806 RepID=Q08RQ0_STIAD|nr:hypothetical protein STIAU_6465 [Stigmatella aurantiaca DW4/3-1]